MNNPPHIVREQDGSRAVDRRVQRTHHALVHALVALVETKRYDAITIQDLLDRAEVGRSTFYSHYRGKDDLLLRSFEWMLEELDASVDCADASPGRLAPVRELFAHVGMMGRFHKQLIRAHMIDRVYQAGTAQMSLAIERRLEARATDGGDTNGVPPAVAAQALAGALFALLKWWVEQDMPHEPERMDAMFHELASGPGATGRPTAP